MGRGGQLSRGIHRAEAFVLPLRERFTIALWLGRLCHPSQPSSATVPCCWRLVGMLGYGEFKRSGSRSLRYSVSAAYGSTTVSHHHAITSGINAVCYAIFPSDRIHGVWLP